MSAAGMASATSGKGSEKVAGASGGGDQLFAVFTDGDDSGRDVGDAGIGEGSKSLFDRGLATGREDVADVVMPSTVEISNITNPPAYRGSQG